MSTRPTVMVVDDERDILIALEDLLEESYRVLAFQEPAAALERLAAEPDVAVLISDQRMPAMPGHRFIAAARELSAAEAILLTGYADMDAVIAAINEGKVTGYVHKPWDAAGLLNMVKLAAERHAMRRALDRERQLFGALLAGSHDAVRLIGGDGAVLRANRDDAYPADEDDLGALHGGDGSTEEVEDGERWLRVQRVPIALGGERLLLRFESDISHERALEGRLRQAEKLEALGTLAGGIAHDFNNLLTAVIGNLELAGRRRDDDRLPHYLANAMEAARRGVALTARLLSFSRQRDLQARHVEIGPLIAGMADLFAHTLGSGVSVRIDGCGPPLGVRADPDQLELAILNLCVNARDAMSGSGIVTIACSIDEGAGPDMEAPPPGFIRIAVRDTGAGMDEATRRRVFEPFFTTKPVGKGTGLGLSMVYGFVTGLGGRIEIDTAPGQGTTVSLLLPAADGSEEDVPAPTAPVADTRPLRILLVEDDPSVSEVTRRYLEDMGHRVDVADGPAAALERLDAGVAIDLLLTDYLMPGGSGLDLVATARAARPGLPALLLTGFAEAQPVPPDVGRLAKPYSPADLAAAIAALVPRPAG